MKIRYTNNDNEVMVEEYSEILVNELTTNNIAYETGYICEDCGCFISEEDATFVTNNHGNDYPVCEDCLSNGDYFYCEDCDNWYDNSVDQYLTHDDRTICSDCRYEDYTECNQCGELYHNDDTNYCDDCDEYFCDDCYDGHCHDDNLLYDYHCFNDWHPTKTPDEPQPQFYIGHELEIDNGNDMSEAVTQITTELNGVCMHDGSLSSNGIEFISHPLSYKYMLSREQDYRRVFDHLVNLGYRSHDTNTCGLHFHVTRPSDEIVDRIILFMETYKEEIITLSRRNKSEIDSWCNFLSDKKYDIDKKTLKSLDYIKKNKETSNRYMALNLTNYRTIEFRIFKGTLNYETFMADFEFVYFLTTLASDVSLPIEELTWEKVVNNGRFLQNYVNEHNLHTDKPIIDYTTEILIARNREKEELKKELYTLYKQVLSKIHNMTTLDKRKKEIKILDRSEFTTITSWLDCLIRDISYFDMLYNDDNEEAIHDVKNRINYIKERIDN